MLALRTSARKPQPQEPGCAGRRADPVTARPRTCFAQRCGWGRQPPSSDACCPTRCGRSATGSPRKRLRQLLRAFSDIFAEVVVERAVKSRRLQNYRSKSHAYYSDPLATSVGTSGRRCKARTGTRRETHHGFDSRELLLSGCCDPGTAFSLAQHDAWRRRRCPRNDPRHDGRRLAMVGRVQPPQNEHGRWPGACNSRRSLGQFHDASLGKRKGTHALQAPHTPCGSQSERNIVVEVLFEKYDAISNPAHMGFKKTYVCVCGKLGQVVRLCCRSAPCGAWIPTWHK